MIFGIGANAKIARSFGGFPIIEQRDVLKIEGK